MGADLGPGGAVLAISCPLWGGLWSVSPPEGPGQLGGEGSTHFIEAFPRLNSHKGCVPAYLMVSVQDLLLDWVWGVGARKNSRSLPWATGRMSAIYRDDRHGEGADLGEKRQDFSFGWVNFEMIIRHPSGNVMKVVWLHVWNLREIVGLEIHSSVWSVHNSTFFPHKICLSAACH